MTDTGRGLTALEMRLLCDLADPQAAPVGIEAFDGADVGVLLGAARDHNVEPVVLRKLKGLRFPEAEGFEDARRAASRDRMYLAAVALALSDQAARVMAAFRKAGVPHALVKGQAFARDLYDEAADRPFTDIDLILPASAAARAGEVMAELGYVQFKRERFDKSEQNEEQKWGLQGDRLMLVELHGNLVHVPALRRRISFGYAEHADACAGGDRPVAGHFVTAVIHAAAGHKFHQLRLLVDVMQAMRRLSGSDLDHLAGVVARLRIQPEVAMSLQLVDALFPAVRATGRAGDIRERLRLRPVPPIVDARSVLDAPGGEFWRSKVRRHAFRLYQMSLARRRSLPRA